MAPDEPAGPNWWAMWYVGSGALMLGVAGFTLAAIVLHRPPLEQAIGVAVTAVALISMLLADGVRP